MSLIGKNPFVNEVLTSCSAEQLTSLSALINNLGSPTVIKLKELKNTDKGVKYASVFLDDFTLVHGLWIYTDTKCGLFAFQNGFDEMQAIRIDTVNKNYEYVYQHLSVTEFRSTLDDVANTGSGGGSGDVTDLASLTDVSISNVTNNQILTYNSTSEKWENKSQIECETLKASSNLEINASVTNKAAYLNTQRFKITDTKYAYSELSSKALTIEGTTSQYGHRSITISYSNHPVITFSDTYTVNAGYGNFGTRSWGIGATQSGSTVSEASCTCTPTSAIFNVYSQGRRLRFSTLTGLEVFKPLIATATYNSEDDTLVVDNSYLSDVSTLELFQTVLINFRNANDDTNCSTAVGLVLRKGSTEMGGNFVVIGTNMDIYDSGDRLETINRIFINYNTGEFIATKVDLSDEVYISSNSHGGYTNHVIDIYKLA